MHHLSQCIFIWKFRSPLPRPVTRTKDLFEKYPVVHLQEIEQFQYMKKCTFIWFISFRIRTKTVISLPFYVMPWASEDLIASIFNYPYPWFRMLFYLWSWRVAAPWGFCWVKLLLDNTYNLPVDIEWKSWIPNCK